jgi:hypothetical protein
MDDGGVMACKKRKIADSYIDVWLADLAKTSQAGKWEKVWCEQCKGWHIKKVAE